MEISLRTLSGYPRLIKLQPKQVIIIIIIIINKKTYMQYMNSISSRFHIFKQLYEVQ